MSEQIKLTEKNLLRYGDIVLSREWQTTNGTNIAEKYIVWNYGRTPQMYLLTMANGEFITMKRV